MAKCQEHYKRKYWVDSRFDEAEKKRLKEALTQYLRVVKHGYDGYYASYGGFGCYLDTGDR